MEDKQRPPPPYEPTYLPTGKEWLRIGSGLAAFILFFSLAIDGFGWYAVLACGVAVVLFFGSAGAVLRTAAIFFRRFSIRELFGLVAYWSLLLVVWLAATRMF